MGCFFPVRHGRGKQFGWKSSFGYMQLNKRSKKAFSFVFSFTV